MKRASLTILFTVVSLFLAPTLAKGDDERVVVAMGDFHGDHLSMLKALRLAGAINSENRWVGRDMVVVQVGDQIDRGDFDKWVLDYMDQLKEQATENGGDVISLLGNHEIMNVESDFTFVSEPSFEAFKEFGKDGKSGRKAAFRPGGPYALKLSERDVAAKIGDVVFVHGGITPKYAKIGINAMNSSVRTWMAAEIDNSDKKKKPAEKPDFVDAVDGPLWSRAYSNTKLPPDCKALQKSLEILDAQYMVVAHTPQGKKGVNNDGCGGRVWRVDTGMSRVYGGPIEVLRIKRGEFEILGR